MKGLKLFAIIKTYYRLKFQDMEAVEREVCKKLEGKKNLLLVKRSSVLEDTVHYMAKDGFNPSSGITVSGCTIQKVT